MSYNGVKKRLPKRRRVVRRRVIALGLLLALAIVVMWLPYFAPQDWLRGIIETELTKALRSPVALEGIRLRGWTSAELRGLTIGPAEKPLAELPQSRVRISLAGLLRGRVEIQRIHLIEPSIYLVRNYDGAWNIERLLQSEGSGRGTEGRISLPAITVVDARARITDRPADSEQNVSGLNIELMRDIAGDSYRFSIQGVFERGENPLVARLGGNVQVRLFQIPVGTGGAIALNNASIAMGYPDGDLVSAVRNGAGVVYWDQFGMRLSSQLSLLDDRIWLSYSDLGPPDGVRTPQFRIHGPALRLERVTAFLNEYFPARISDEPRPRADSIPIAFLQSLRGQYEISFGEFGAPNWRFNNVRAMVGANNGVIRVHEAHMDFNGGRIDASGRFDMSGAKPAWELNAVARGIHAMDNINPLLKDILPVVEFHQPFDLREISLSAAGVENEDLWASLRGRIEMELRESELVVGDIPEYIKRLFPLIDPTDLRFEKGDLNAIFRGERIDVTARFLTGRWDGVDTFARGQVFLKERRVDLDFGVDVLSTLGARLRPESDLHGRTDLALFRVRGEFAKPALLEWYQIAAQGVAGIVRQILWDDPIALVNPNMTVREKADYFRGRIQSTLGLAVRPLLLVGDGAKALVDGAYGGTRSFLRWLVGADNPDEDD